MLLGAPYRMPKARLHSLYRVSRRPIASTQDQRGRRCVSSASSQVLETVNVKRPEFPYCKYEAYQIGGIKSLTAFKHTVSSISYTLKHRSMAVNLVKLISSDAEIYEVDVAVAMESQTVKDLLSEVKSIDEPILLPHISGNTLAKVIEYCKYHVENATSEDEDEIEAWEADFMKVDVDTILSLVKAANYLKVKSLLDLTCHATVDLIRGETPEEVRFMFHIKNDYKPEEEAEIHGQNLWAIEWSGRCGGACETSENMMIE